MTSYREALQLSRAGKALEAVRHFKKLTSQSTDLLRKAKSPPPRWTILLRLHSSLKAKAT